MSLKTNIQSRDIYIYAEAEEVRSGLYHLTSVGSVSLAPLDPPPKITSAYYHMPGYYTLFPFYYIRLAESIRDNHL